MACGLLVLGVGCSGDEEGVEDPMAADGGAMSTPGMDGGLTPSDSPAAPGGVGGVGGYADSVGIGGALEGNTTQNAVSGEGEGAVSGPGTRFVKTHHLFIRSGPGMKYPKVGAVKFNQPVNVQAVYKKGRWVKIGEGQYVGSRYLGNTKNTKPWNVKKYAH